MFKKGYNKEIARAVGLYIAYSVLGPLLIFGGIGYFLDKVLNTHFFLLFSVFLSYIISNVLMFRKLKSLNHSINVIDSNFSNNKVDNNKADNKK